MSHVMSLPRAKLFQLAGGAVFPVLEKHQLIRGATGLSPVSRR